MEKIAALLKQYKGMILYLVFGVMTTAVNWVTYYLCYNVLQIGNTPANIVSWITAVAFAFVTNKIWVFESKSWDIKIAGKELTDFVLCRLGSGVVEIGMMFVLVDVMHWNALLMKAITAFVVIVLNYFASKIFVFKK